MNKKKHSVAVVIKHIRFATILMLVACLTLNSIAFAGGLNSKKAAYQGGSTRETHFPGVKESVVGDLITGDNALSFEYKLSKDKNSEKKVYSIPYDKIIDLEYGQKSGRRVGTAVATAILISPIGLIALFSKKRKHYVTIGYKDENDKDQVAVFEVGKDIIRVTLSVLETKSGKKLEYQDDEAKKTSKG